MGGLTVKGGKLLDFSALYAEVEKLLPHKMEGIPSTVVGYKPQDKQRHLLEAVGLLDWYEGTGEIKDPLCQVIGYGGAAFGGKTYGMLGLAAVCAYAFPGCQIAFFRRTFTEIDGAGGAMQKAYSLFGSIAHARDSGKNFVFPNGSQFFFQHCENENDVHKYEGKEFDILLIDEATHFTWYIIDTLLNTRNRVSGDNGIKKPFAILCTNPGNIGHGWYMELFGLDKAGQWNTKKEPLRVRNQNHQWVDTFFIPAYISDNTIGIERDPEYETRLRQADPDLAEALIKGDWKVFSGMAFRQFDSTIHVVNTKDLPKDFKTYPKWRAVDWGYDAPFCCLWGAHDPGTGRVFVYREVYEAGLTDAQQAQAIVINSPADERISITYGDPISFRTRHSRGNLSYTSADEYLENGVPIWNADNDRVGGKRKIDQRLATIQDGKPGLIITDNCINLIRTLPKLARSQTNPEDVALNQEDHAYSTLRYLLTNVGMHSKKQGEGKQSTEYNPYLNIRGI